MTIAKFEKVSFEEWENAWDSVKHFDDDKLKETYENIQLPKRATVGSAGYDFFTPVAISFYKKYSSRVVKNIPTGIRCNIQCGYFLQLVPKSGLGVKHGFSFQNTLGIIDSDYYYSKNEGHIKYAPLVETELNLKTGDKIFQGIFLPYYLAEEDTPTQVRNGGHGSTGK